MVVLVAVSAGILADRYRPIPLEIWAAFGLGSLAGWAVCWSWKRDGLASGWLLLALVSAGGLWHHLRWRMFSPWEIARYVAGSAEYINVSSQAEASADVFSQTEISESVTMVDPDFQPLWGRSLPVALEGTVQTTPHAVPLSRIILWQRERNLRLFQFQVAVCRVRDQTQWRPASGRVLVWVNARRLEDLTGRFGLGDRVRIFGQLGRMAPPANPGQYDFADRVRGDRILCTLRCFGPECIELLAFEPWYRPDRLLEAFRRHSAARFHEHMPGGGEDYGSGNAEWGNGGFSGGTKGADAHTPGELSPTGHLAATILLGLREDLPPDFTEPFIRTGTVHLLAISGFHVGLVALVVSCLMRLAGAGRTVEISAIALGCLVYMLLSGARPPTVRATILVGLACLAALAGRRPLSWNTLAAAGLVVLALNPAELFRLGTQLSFLSVGALMLLVPEGQLPRLTPPKPPPETLWPLPRWLQNLHQWLPWNWAVPEGQQTVWRSVRRWKQYFWTWLGALDPADPLDRLIGRSMTPAERLVRRLVRTVGFMFLAGAAIWGIVTPLIMARMHLCPLVGLLLNALAWIPMTGAMISGFLFLALGWLWTPLGWLLGRACYFCLHTLQRLVDSAVQWPGSYFWTPGPETWWLVGFYGGLAAWLLWGRFRLRRRWALAALAIWMAVGLCAHPVRQALRPQTPGRWECTFLSVGHGLAVVIHLPNGQTWLYDAGAVAPPDRTAQIIAGYLWSRGIRQVDAVFLSHLDQDHFNALPGLLERIRIQRVIMASEMLRKIGRLWREYENLRQQEIADSEQADRSALASAPPLPPELELYQAIRQRNVLIYTIDAPWQWQPAPAIACWVFHPPIHGVPGSDNANSLVLALQVHGRRVLLAGDLEPPGLQKLFAQPAWHCDLLLVPHHGSQKSRPAELARWSRPQWAVISGGWFLNSQVAEQLYRSAGARVCHTGRHGALFAELLPQQVHLHSQWTPKLSSLPQSHQKAPKPAN